MINEESFTEYEDTPLTAHKKVTYGDGDSEIGRETPDSYLPPSARLPHKSILKSNISSDEDESRGSSISWIHRDLRMPVYKEVVDFLHSSALGYLLVLGIAELVEKSTMDDISASFLYTACPYVISRFLNHVPTVFLSKPKTFFSDYGFIPRFVGSCTATGVGLSIGALDLFNTIKSRDASLLAICGFFTGRAMEALTQRILDKGCETQALMISPKL